MIAKILLKDEVKCVVLGLTNEERTELYEVFGIHPPNYFFHPKFKLGRWDGKLRFFKKNGATYINLLSDIIPHLIKWGYEIRVDDQRPNLNIHPKLATMDMFSHVLHPKTNKPLILREYQVEGVNHVIKDNGGVIVAATGSGKTFMNGALVKLYGDIGLRCITIVPSADLVTQTTLNLLALNLDVGEYSGSKKELDKTHIVSTWQALKNNPTILNNMRVVILDECHGARGDIIQKLLIDHGSMIAVRFGLTGTIPKDETDALAVRLAIGEVKYTITAKHLIDSGVLAKLQIDIIQTEIDLTNQFNYYIPEDKHKNLTYSQFKDEYFPDFASEKSYSQTNPDRREIIVNHFKQKHELGNTFILVNGVRYGRTLAKLLDAHFVHGKDEKKVRKEIYDLFEHNNDVIVVATVGVAAVGLDIPRIFHLGLVDIGKSFIRVIQSIGRGLRVAEDKSFVLVSDICTDLKYSKRHLTTRKRYYKEAQYPFKVQKIKCSSNVDLFEE